VLNTITTVVAALLGIHALVKFVFFALPYRKRRAALDKSYGGKASATTTSNRVLLGFAIALAAVVLWRGIDAVSFLGGIWIGATLIQLYFHEFHVPVAPERAAPEPVGAMTSVLPPSAIADHASACAAVGAAKVPVNHSRVSALKRSSGSEVI